MTIGDLVNYLKTLDQEAEILSADYYYDSLEGFTPGDFPLKEMIVRPAESAYYKHYKGNVYLMDFTSIIQKD